MTTHSALPAKRPKRIVAGQRWPKPSLAASSFESWRNCDQERETLIACIGYSMRNSGRGNNQSAGTRLAFFVAHDEAAATGEHKIDL